METILLVDDDAHLRSVTQLIFRDAILTAGWAPTHPRLAPSQAARGGEGGDHVGLLDAGARWSSDSSWLSSRLSVSNSRCFC